MKSLILTTALALFADPSAAETRWKWGCEWRKPADANFWYRVDARCEIDRNAFPAVRSETVRPSEPDGGDNDGPGDAEGPDDDKPADPDKGDTDDKPEDPGKGDDKGGTKPGHGHGDDNRDHSGPPGQNKDGDKPGKGKGWK